MNGFYTEAPIKTSGLRLAVATPESEQVEFGSLRVFGDDLVNQSSVANIKNAGQYANFVLQMECGRCGYLSPVESHAGTMERQCYCCGAPNTGFRGMITMFVGGTAVEI